MLKIRTFITAECSLSSMSSYQNVSLTSHLSCGPSEPILYCHLLETIVYKYLACRNFIWSFTTPWWIHGMNSLLFFFGGGGVGFFLFFFYLISIHFWTLKSYLCIKVKHISHHVVTQGPSSFHCSFCTFEIIIEPSSRVCWMLRFCKWSSISRVEQ